MSEGSWPPEDVQPLATPVGVRQARTTPEDARPLARPVVARRARMHEFFRRRLQAAKEAGHDRAWVYRDEIVAEGEAMGLSEAQSLAMAQDELEQHWIEPAYRPERGRFMAGAMFTDFRGLCRYYGYP
jgi:hypothetical protein